MNANEQPKLGSSEQAKDRAQDVYDRLRHAILVMDLMPGEKLSERALQDFVNGSRTPIREALLRLEVEGLITRRGRSYNVTPLELSEIMEAFEFREHIEAVIAQLCCQRATAADLARVQQVLDQSKDKDDAATWFAIGTDFHVMLAELSGNRFLVRAMIDIMTRIERARWIMCSLPSARSDAYQQHSHILNLIGENKPTAAAEALILHARGLRDILATALSQARLGLRARGMVGTAPE